MKIERNGVFYELTSEELYKAYLEQQQLFDIETVETQMENFLPSEDLFILCENEEFIKKAAAELRSRCQKYDEPYSESLKEAVYKIKEEFLKRYVYGKDPNTKDWFIYDNEKKYNVRRCDNLMECLKTVRKLLAKKFCDSVE